MLKGRGFLRVFLALFLLSGIDTEGNNNFLKVLLGECVPPVVENLLVHAKAPFNAKQCTQ